MEPTQQLTDYLDKLLADTYLLYVKTQNFHWNVIGPHFFSYHAMFDEQYKALAEAVDEIAERMRALAVRAPATLAHFLKITSLQEASSPLSAEEMLESLLKDHSIIAAGLNNAFSLAESCQDEVTLDFLISRKTWHDKIVWMLRSSINQR